MHRSPFTDEQLMGIVHSLYGFEPNTFYMRFMSLPKLSLASLAVRTALLHWP